MVFVNTEFFATLPVDAATQVLQGVVNEAIQSHGDSGALRRSFEEAIRAAALQEVSPVPPPGLRPPGGSAVAGPSLQVGRAPAPAPQQLPHIPILGRTAGGDGEDGDGSFGSRPDDGSGAIPANASFLWNFRNASFWERPRRPAGEGDDGSGSQGIAHSLLQLATAQANGASGGLGAEAGAEREDVVEETEREGDALDVGEGAGAGGFDAQASRLVTNLSRVMLFKALGGDAIDKSKVINEARGEDLNQEWLANAAMDEAEKRLMDVFGFEVKQVSEKMMDDLPDHFKTRYYLTNEVADDDEGSHRRALHSANAAKAAERALLMAVLAFAYCKGATQVHGGVMQGAGEKTRWITEHDLYALLHAVDENIPEEPPSAEGKKRSRQSAGSRLLPDAASGEGAGQTPDIDVLLEQFVAMDYLLRDNINEPEEQGGSSQSDGGKVVAYAMGPRSVLEISRRQIIQFCSGVLGYEQPDPTMMAEIDKEDEEEESESEEEENESEEEEESESKEDSSEQCAPSVFEGNAEYGDGNVEYGDGNAEFGGRGGFSSSEDDADSMNDNTSDNKAEVEDSHSAEEDDDDGSLVLSEEEADEDEEADGDEDDDASLDDGWQFDAKVYADADIELQRVVAEGSSMDGVSSFKDLGYSKYSPRTRSGNVSGVYLSVHKEGDGSYLVKIGKGTKDKVPKGDYNQKKGPLDGRCYCAQTYRGSYGMVRVYKAPGILGKMVPALEKMIKIHSASFKGEEYTGSETFRMSSKTQALRFLRRIDFWIQKLFDERELTVPASATEMEGGKQICLRRQDEDVSRSIFYFRNRKGLAGAGVAYNPGGGGGGNRDVKLRADKFRAFFSSLDFDAKVDYLLTKEGKKDAKAWPVDEWKKEMRATWDSLPLRKTERLISINVYRDRKMQVEIESHEKLGERLDEIVTFQTQYDCPGKYPDPNAGQLTSDERKLGKLIQNFHRNWILPNSDVGEEYAELYWSLGIAEFERKPKRWKKRAKAPTKAARERGNRRGSFYSDKEKKRMADVRARSIFTNADYEAWRKATNAPGPANGYQFVYPADNDSDDEIVLYQSSNRADAIRAMAELAEGEQLGDAVKYNNSSGMRGKVDTDERWNGLWIRSYGETDDGWCKGGQARAAKREWIASMKQKKAVAPAKRPKTWPSGPLQLAKSERGHRRIDLKQQRHSKAGRRVGDADAK